MLTKPTQEIRRKVLNGLKQENNERKLSKILTRKDEIVHVLTKIDFFLEKPAVNNPVLLRVNNSASRLSTHASKKACPFCNSANHSA